MTLAKTQRRKGEKKQTCQYFGSWRNFLSPVLQIGCYGNEAFAPLRLCVRPKSLLSRSLCGILNPFLT
jgi:hypothetical protein